MIRVLQVLGTVGLGGAESRVMDLYRHMNREEIQFDFLVTSGTKGYYEEEIENLGGKIYYLPAFRVYNYLEYVKAVRVFFSEHKGEYVAVHGHMTSTASIYLPIAKKSGVPLTIAHARSAGVDPGIKGKITRFLRKNLYKKCDMMLSCSDEAIVSVFGVGREVTFMPNAIDTKDFMFDASVRDEIRTKYGLQDKFVVGHVGSFRYAKNHEFVIDVFAELVKRYNADNSITNGREPILMLLGDGELRSSIETKVSALNLNDNVIFTGNMTPVAPFYQAFDILLFPSHYEGMPGTVVEAQAAGLPSLISDKITSQVGITSLVTYKSLEEPVSEWIDVLLSIVGSPNDRSQVLTFDGKRLSDTMYDVNKQVEYYTDLYNGNKS